jgi:hypothetical protein
MIKNVYHGMYDEHTPLLAVRVTKHVTVLRFKIFKNLKNYVLTGCIAADIHVDSTTNNRCKCVNTNDEDTESDVSQLVYKPTEGG